MRFLTRLVSVSGFFVIRTIEYDQENHVFNDVTFYC
jgi:hypothetical protein